MCEWPNYLIDSENKEQALNTEQQSRICVQCSFPILAQLWSQPAAEGNKHSCLFQRPNFSATFTS